MIAARILFSDYLIFTKSTSELLATRVVSLETKVINF